MNTWRKPYDTGWIARSDWTNVHPGSDTTKDTDSNITHNFNAPLSKLLAKLFVSTDGTDATSFEIIGGDVYDFAANVYGFNIYQEDNNNIIIQTGTHGIFAIQADGTGLIIDVEDWHYKAKVWYLG